MLVAPEELNRIETEWTVERTQWVKRKKVYLSYVTSHFDTFIPFRTTVKADMDLRVILWWGLEGGGWDYRGGECSPARSMGGGSRH